MKVRKFLAAWVCLSLLSTSAAANPAPRFDAQQRQEEQRAKKELERKALAMLGELIEEASSFKLPENRAHILLVAADLLWPHDEKRARALFAELTSAFEQMAHPAEEDAEMSSDVFRWQLSQKRQQAVQMIAARDAQLASDFLAATRPDPKDVAYNAESETQLELMLAQQIARQDPKKALQAAKEKLATTKNPSVVSGILSELRQKDAAAAQELADSILARLRSEERLSYESASFALSLLSYAPNPARNDGAQYQPVDQPAALITPAAARELIEKVVAAALANLAEARNRSDSQSRSYAAGLLQNLKSLMPYVERYAPATVATLKRSLPEAEKLMDNGQRRWNELNALAEKGSAQLLIEAAAKAPQEMQPVYYQRAAQIEREKGNPDSARQLISEHVPEGPQRQQMLRELDQQTLWQNINSGKFDDARGQIAKLRSQQERVNALIALSGQAWNAGQKELAAQVLDEAWALVAGPVETNQQFGAQLQIAGSYNKINPARSFEIIEATIDQYNELFTAAAFVENFYQQGTVRNKEMILSNGGGGGVSSYLYQYAQQLGELSRTDLSHVQAVVARFARPEARATLRLVLLTQLLRTENGGVGPGIGISIGRGISGGNR